MSRKQHFGQSVFPTQKSPEAVPGVESIVYTAHVLSRLFLMQVGVDSLGTHFVSFQRLQ